MSKVKIKELREQNNLTQTQVAQNIGIAKNTYIKYEKGEQSPQLVTIEKLALFYKVPLYELIENQELKIDDKLKSKMALIEQLEDEEKAALIMLIEGLLLRHQNKAIIN
ncbi:MAG: helix-turn-helix transcriptional regulator [Flavobacteriaceae bacterium]|nr:helix-turn-helix transcriptional regulator [Flavobacteriaceae bacterium]